MTQEVSYRASVEFWHEADDIKRFQVCFDALLKYIFSVILQMSEGPFCHVHCCLLLFLCC